MVIAVREKGGGLKEITVHFIVEKSKPICDPEDEDTTSIDKFVDIDDSHDALSNVHATRRFESIVTYWKLFILQKCKEFFSLDDFFSKTVDQIETLFNRESV